MNRRSFLKRCSILPFVGSLVVGASEGLTVAKVQEIAKMLEAAELDGKIKLSLGCKEFRDALNKVVKDKLEGGLDEAFCYGGRLFRVYDWRDYKVMQVRNKHLLIGHMLSHSEFYEWRYRYGICEEMLDSLGKHEV